jgi:hypothetical protein
MFTALASLGYRPSVPITKEPFSNSDLRNGWVRDNGMQVLQFWSDAHIETSVVSVETALAITRVNSALPGFGPVKCRSKPSQPVGCTSDYA